jgi:hypothetical protein
MPRASPHVARLAKVEPCGHCLPARLRMGWAFAELAIVLAKALRCCGRAGKPGAEMHRLVTSDHSVSLVACHLVAALGQGVELRAANGHVAPRANNRYGTIAFQATLAPGTGPPDHLENFSTKRHLSTFVIESLTLGYV